MRITTADFGTELCQRNRHQLMRSSNLPVYANLLLYLVAHTAYSVTEYATFSERHMISYRIIKDDQNEILHKAHKVIFAVKHRNLDILEETLMRVSDPASLEYGNYWGVADVAKLTSNPEGLSHLKRYLFQNGVQITKVSLHGEYVSATAKIMDWEAIFNTKFYTFEHRIDSSRNTLRAQSYTLHDDIAQHVSAVFRVIDLPLDRPRITMVKQSLMNSHVTPAGSGSVYSSGTITPAVLNAYYNVSSNVGDKSISQFVYMPGLYSTLDLALFQRTYGLPIEPVDNDPDHCANKTCNLDSCGEEALDIQWIMAMAQNMNTTVG